MTTAKSERNPRAQGLQVITLAGGCFWCIEAVFNELKGVVKAESGYSGGSVPNPSYQEVCSGTTGHAEVVQITFDPSVIALQEIFEIFFSVHDPTTLNRQGADVGEQYRSAIFYQSEEQRRTAEEVIRRVSASEAYGAGPVVTQLVPLEAFHKAEDYHQEYYANNSAQPYCQIVISPKVNKFRKHFQNKLKAP
jgi:peptide-methionine (S)-S-oxide reductase